MYLNHEVKMKNHEAMIVEVMEKFSDKISDNRRELLKRIQNLN